MFIFVAMIGVLVLMMVLSGRAKKKEETKKASMLSALKRHDRVQTIGGIIATVSEVRDTEVVLTIDEQSKTRLRVAKSAIQQVLREAAPSAEAPSADASRELAAHAAG
jgi:preprotein translocase subunit YajC